MKGILSYLLKPSTNDPEAVKQAYYDSLKSTHVMMLISFVMSAIFLVMSYVNPVFFGTEPTYHRLIYLILFLIVMLWFAVARYAVVDYNSIAAGSADNKVKVMIGEVPAAYQDVKFSHDSVEYIIEKH